MQWAAAELILGANPAAFMYLAGPSFAASMHRHGTAEQQHWAELMIERGWGATMVLTEPDAGLRRRRGPHQGGRRSPTAPGTSRA